MNKPPAILIVDDSRTIRNIIKKSICGLQLGEIIEACNGLDAINSLVSRSVDLVISDIDMPKMNGLELIREIRKTESLKNIPVLVISANASASNVVATAKLKVQDFIAKPIDEESLRNKVESILFSPLNEIKKDLRILVADDLPSARKIIKKMLNEIGLENIFFCNNGYQAIASIESQTPDLVFLDLELPDMSGIQLLEKIRSKDNKNKLPVILICSELDKDTVLNAARSGANSLLPKPFDKEILYTKILQSLSVKS